MSGMKRFTQKFVNALGGRGFMSNKQRREMNDTITKERKNTMYNSAEMPDPLTLRKDERRKAAKRKGSRVSSILTTDEDRETLG